MLYIVVGCQGQQGFLSWAYKNKIVNNVFIDYLGIIFICVMSTTLPTISLVETELEFPTLKSLGHLYR